LNPVDVKMAKGKAQVKPKTDRKRKNRVNRIMSTGLDSTAAAWAKLLTDPCNAPLTSPCYPSSSGGSLVRVESDGIYGNGATATAGAVLFTPGLMTRNSGLGSISYLVGTDDVTNLPWNTAAASSNPGYYTASSWSAYRPVAACMQVSWPGSELNRQGIVSIGQVPAQLGSETANVGQLRTACPIVTRMPETTLEAKFRPGERDGLYNDPTNVNAFTDAQGRNSIMCTWAGLPAATGVRIRLVVVYEYQVAGFSGSVVNLTTNANSASKSSVNEILGALDKAGRWAYSIATSPFGQAAYDFGVTAIKTASRAVPLLM